MTRLLVSVRSTAEAEVALAGGADLVDVKEPARGSLGRADDDTLAAVVRVVAGRRPVSAAFGELIDAPVPFLQPGLTFLKWGLAGFLPRGNAWRTELNRAAIGLATGCRPVAVAYADWQRAQAPPPEDVGAYARQARVGAFLVDTWGKDGTNLLDWMSLSEIFSLCSSCQAAGVPVALAGSLGLDQVRTLWPVRPDWFAVRGAVCRGGQRTGPIDADKVRQLVELLHAPVTSPERERRG